MSDSTSTRHEGNSPDALNLPEWLNSEVVMPPGYLAERNRVARLALDLAEPAAELAKAHDALRVALHDRIGGVEDGAYDSVVRLLGFEELHSLMLCLYSTLEAATEGRDEVGVDSRADDLTRAVASARTMIEPLSEGEKASLVDPAIGDPDYVPRVVSPEDDELTEEEMDAFEAQQEAEFPAVLFNPDTLAFAPWLNYRTLSLPTSFLFNLTQLATLLLEVEQPVRNVAWHYRENDRQLERSLSTVPEDVREEFWRASGFNQVCGLLSDLQEMLTALIGPGAAGEAADEMFRKTFASIDVSAEALRAAMGTERLAAYEAYRLAHPDFPTTDG